MKKSKTELPVESPVPFHTGCNGEFVPRPRTARDRFADALFHRLAGEKARRLGISRRVFVESTCGAATALAVINLAYGCDDNGGSVDGPGADSMAELDAAVDAAASPDMGGFVVDAEATMDEGVACDRLGGPEFIFDVQTHHVNPEGAWRGSFGWERFLASLPQAACGDETVDCYDAEHFLREMFVNSDTTMAVLSALPAAPGENPLEIEEAVATKAIMDALDGAPRLVLHGMVLPDRGPEQLEGMQRLKEEHGVAAWKCYTGFGGWRLDDEATGVPFIERALELDRPLICVHKGFALLGFDAAFSSPADVGVVAARFPEARFVVYHSGFESGVREGPYDPDNPNAGVDRLIKSLQDNGIGPDGNVYAELGSTWRAVMTSPGQAAHLLGKLLLHLGPDRIVWGTDSIWYGSPQDQIMAFRSFEIGARLQEDFGYPPLDAAAKAKILGLNAARLYGVDPEARRCAVNADSFAQRTRVPSFRGYGPRNRREFLAFLRSRDGAPG